MRIKQFVTSGLTLAVCALVTAGAVRDGGGKAPSPKRPATRPARAADWAPSAFAAPEVRLRVEKSGGKEAPILAWSLRYDTPGQHVLVKTITNYAAPEFDKCTQSFSTFHEKKDSTYRLDIKQVVGEKYREQFADKGGIVTVTIVAVRLEGAFGPAMRFQGDPKVLAVFSVPVGADGEYEAEKRSGQPQS